MSLVIREKIPTFKTDYKIDLSLRRRDGKSKEKGKEMEIRKGKARPSPIEPGDQVVIKNFINWA